MRARLLRWLSLVSLLLACTQVAHAAEPRFLEVIVNDRTTRFVAEIIERDGDLLAKAADLDDMGLAAPQQVPADGLVDLNRLPGVSVRVDERTLLLYIRATNQALRAQQYSATSNTGGPATMAQTSEGMIVNYDLSAVTVAGKHYGNGLVNVTGFSSEGTFDNRFILRAGDYQERNFQRLDTVYTWSDPQRSRRLRVGDVISGGLSWTRPVRLGGVQWTTDFTLRPDLITFPSTNLSGVAAIPSSVDVLVNGVSQFRQEVDQGPFVINRLPVTTGAGQVQLVLRDALGRETVENLPIYSSDRLLGDGFDSYSLEYGFVRKLYGLPGDNYSATALIGTWRHGLEDSKTFELHSEAAYRLGLLGGGINAALGAVGIATFSAARSVDENRNGTQLSTSFERNSRAFSMSASLTRASSGYCDVACKAGDPVPRRTGRVSAGVPLAERMYIAAALTQLNAPGRSQNIFSGIPNFSGTTVSSQPAVDRASIASLSLTYSSYDGYSVLVTALKDYDQRHSSAMYVSLSIPLDQRRSVSLNSTHDHQGNSFDVQATQASILPGDIGWRAQSSLGALQRQFVEADYQTTSGRVYAGLDRFDGQLATRAGISGAIVTLDGDAYRTRDVSDAFAVVDVSGQPNVRVYQENRYIGRTGDDGKLLIPQMQSNRSNRIAIDPLDLGMDAYIPVTTQQLVPAERSGVRATFKVERGRQAVVIFVDPAGKVLPVGSVIVQADGHVSPLGHDGQAYLMNLDAENTVTIAYRQSRCTAHFEFDTVANDLPTIGPVTCTPGP